MNKRKKLACALALTGMLGFSEVALGAGAQVAVVPGDGNVKTTDGSVLYSGSGSCVRTGYWTPGSSAPGCDQTKTKLPKTPKKHEASVQQEPLETAPEQPEVPTPPSSEKVTYSADAFFDFDKAALKPEGRMALGELVSKLAGLQVEAVVAVGHTDSVGTKVYNQALSLRRAESVKNYLVSKGIDASLIFTEGKGMTQPLVPNTSRVNRAKNRRVEIEVVANKFPANN